MDLQEAYSRFHQFNGKTMCVETTDKRFPSLLIKFSDGQFVHLIGLHKIYHARSKEILEKVISGTITYATAQKNGNFNAIRDRIKNFDFLLVSFERQLPSVVIQVSKSDRDDRMQLDFVFSGDRRGRKMIIGLRQDCNNPKTFWPVTFFVTKARKFNYLYSRRITIKSMNWLS